MKINKFLYSTTLFFAFGLLNGQRQTGQSVETLHITNPVSHTTLQENSRFPVKLDNALYDVKRSNFPYFQEQTYVQKNQSATLTISEEKFVVLASDVSSRLMSFYGKFIGNDFSIITRNLNENNKTVVVTAVNPYRINNSGQIEELISYKANWEIKDVPASNFKTAASVTFTNSSVLNSGSLYKIGITKTGIYKISKSFLTSIGMNVNNINPKNLRIYGNGGAKLPLYNGAFRYDDLVENSVQVIGENDNSFDNSDYILFYGQSTATWKLDTGHILSCLDFTVNPHYYSDTTYYYITADHGPGKRILSKTGLSVTPTNTINTYDYYDYHELNVTNFIKSGSEFYGEYFDLNTSYNFNYPIPNLVVGDTVTALVKVAARSLAGSQYSSSFCGAIFNFTAAPVNLNDYLGDYVNVVSNCSKAICNNSSLLNFNISKLSPNAVAWLDKLIFNCRRNLVFNNAQFNFRDHRTVGTGNVSQLNINSNGYTNVEMWDVTDFLNPKNLTYVTNGNQLEFQFTNDSLHEFVIHNSSSYFTPHAIGLIENQNLHSIAQADYVIVAYPQFVVQAQKLAQIHQQYDTMTTAVVTADQIYNEFSSGKPDPTAIRDFIRMLYFRNLSSGKEVKYLLLFGDGSYRTKDRYNPSNSAMLPVFETGYPLDNSWNPTLSTVCDDFYGWMDNNEGDDWSNCLVDVGIGRFPVKTMSEAVAAVDKTENYYKRNFNFNVFEAENLCTTASQFPQGDWRNWLAFIADDEDYQTHMSDADALTTKIKTNHPEYNIDKIYSDAFVQYSTPGGQRYYDVSNGIDHRFDKGCLIMNYTGHGGEVGLGHERFLEISQIQSYTNKNNMPLLVTATCEFSRFDDPDRTSAGELCFLNPNGAAIALLTTVRLAFSNTNFILNSNLYDFAFDTLPNGKMPALGDIVRQTKRKSGIQFYFLNFHLLGDPALKLAYPMHKVFTTHINNNPVSSSNNDTIKALSKVTVKGFIGDKKGNKLTGFNGVLNPTVFDKEQLITCLGNDVASVTSSGPFKFKQQKNIIYKGKVQVVNGDFSFTFIVPKDIAYNFDFGKLSYYAHNGVIDANGYNNNFYVGGSANNVAPDYAGPGISLYMNDKKFVNGGTTNEKPKLYAEVADSSGVNTVGTGIGHDITAILDENSSKPIVLNDYYEADLNSYQKGKIRYPFNELSEGSHRLSLKVWDVQNNSSVVYTDFVVSKSAEMALTHVLNYPNPFTTKTQFYFENNQCCQTMNVNIQIFTISGKMVKTISQTTTNEGFRSSGIDWDGKDEFGDKLAKGVYIYKLSVTAADSKKAEKTEKLVILN